MSKSATIDLNINTAPTRAPVSGPVYGPPTRRAARRRRQRQRRKQRRRGQLGGSAKLPVRNSRPFTRAYLSSLNDPFSFGPVRLGWGTLVHTELYTGYLRASLTTNADGSFAIFVMPSIGNSNGPVWTNTAGSGTTTWAQGSLSNPAPIATALVEARVVSAGIRVLPQVAATAVPGVLYAGDIPAASLTGTTSGLTLQTPANLTSSPLLRFGYGATGATALSRPVDPASYQFLNVGISGYTAGTVAVCSVPLIVGMGFPASTTVYYEIAVNVEGIPYATTATAALQGTGETDKTSTENTPAQEWPNMETMWKALSEYLAPSGVVETLASSAKAAGSMAAAGAALKMVRGSRARIFDGLDGVRNPMLMDYP